MDETDVALAKDREEAAIMRGVAVIAALLHTAPEQPLSDECEDCGTTIPEKRRMAMPFCRRCVDCQADMEKT